MINLQDSSGLPLLFEPRDNFLQPAGEIQFESKETIKLDSLRPTLLNKTLRYPASVYTEYSDICIKGHNTVFSKNKIHFNISSIPAGLLGVEYMKTHIFAPDKDQNKIAAIADIIYGKGVVLIQKIKEKGDFDFDTEITYACYFTVKQGDKVIIPQKYMYTFINSGARPLLVGKVFEDDGKIDYRTIWKEQGMCYYAIRKNARREIVKNPRYKEIPCLLHEKIEDNNKKFRFTAKKPLYTQIVKNPEKFKKLLV